MRETVWCSSVLSPVQSRQYNMRHLPSLHPPPPSPLFYSLSSPTTSCLARPSTPSGHNSLAHRAARPYCTHRTQPHICSALVLLRAHATPPSHLPPAAAAQRAQGIKLVIAAPGQRQQPISRKDGGCACACEWCDTLQVFSKTNSEHRRTQKSTLMLTSAALFSGTACV